MEGFYHLVAYGRQTLDLNLKRNHGIERCSLSPHRLPPLHGPRPHASHPRHGEALRLPRRRRHHPHNSTQRSSRSHLLRNAHLLLRPPPPPPPHHPSPPFDPRENYSLLRTGSEKLSFVLSLDELRPQLEKAFLEIRPDSIVTDMFFPWTSAFANDVLGVPRFVFHGTNLFSQCSRHSWYHHKPLPCGTLDGEEIFLLPGLPHQIKLFKSQVFDTSEAPPEIAQLFMHMRESEAISGGIIANSFYELEPEYAKYHADHIGTAPTWFVGPVSLCNVDKKDLLTRGDINPSAHVNVLKWLDSKPPGSVLYICFGSVSRFGSAQLREIAMGLESAGCRFVWVVRQNDSVEWLKGGLEEKILEGDGLILREWAPQMMILGHVATGGFLTHCGWNSCLEGISAGLPMVTWPLFAEQFYNERFLVDVLGVGVGVGNRHDVKDDDTEELVFVRREEIAKAVKMVMGGGDEAREMKKRVKELSGKATKATEEGGSSYQSLGRFIEHLMCNKCVQV